MRRRCFVAILPLVLIAWMADAAGAQPSKLPMEGTKTHRIEEFAPESEFLQAGGIKTHFVHKGETGSPIVLVHGFAANTYTWRQSLVALSQNHRVFALDVKGFGLTEKPRDGQYHINAYAEHLLAFLDALKLEKPILIGSSLGGAIILQVALQHPDRVGGLVLVDAAPLDIGRGSKPPNVGGEKSVLKAFSKTKPTPALMRLLITRDLVARGLRNSFYNKALVTAEMIDAYYRPITIDGAAEAFASMFVATPESKMPDLPPLAKLKIPTLVIWGRHDEVLPVAQAKIFSDSIPGARLVIFEDAGHLPHEEDPPRFSTLIEEFVRGIP